MVEAKSVLSDLDLFYITPLKSHYVMWTIFDEKVLKRFRFIHDGLESPYELVRLGIGTMEYLMSTMLNRPLSSDDYCTAVQVIDWRPFAPIDSRKVRGDYRSDVQNALERLIPMFLAHYPQSLRTIYLICPPKEVFAPLPIPDNILQKCVLLDDRKHLATHLGSGVPPEFGGTGKPLKDMDCFRDPNIERENTEDGIQIEPRRLWKQHEQLPAKETDDNLNTKCPGKPLHSEQGIYKQLDSDRGRLLYSETIGPPSIVLDPKDLDVAEDLCPPRADLPRVGPRVVLADSDMVAKFGAGVRLAEAEAMHLAQTLTSVPVPKVLSAYVLNDICYIIMSYENGESLCSYWDRASDREKMSVISQLHDNVEQIRAIKGDYIGGLNRSPCKGLIFKAGWGDSATYSYGPYNSEAESNEGIVQALEDRYAPNCRSTDLHFTSAHCAYIINQMVRELKGHRIVFTHGDLRPANILVRADGTVVFLGWGLAGFWPEYWEHYRAMFHVPWTTSWDREVELFIPPYHIENSVIKRVTDVLWY